MRSTLIISSITNWVLGIVVLLIGLLNLFLVHPVPGVIFLLLSCLYLPQTNALLRQKFNFAIPVAVKIILGLIIIQFTLGVSDLGDMLD